MTVMDRATTSRTIAQQIQSVVHHSVSVRSIRRRLQQRGISTRRPLLRLPQAFAPLMVKRMVDMVSGME
ncbi:hypothetical protein TNCV_3802871 [Trichonephila clavipes]|nr:hypothetical protein TNCV_3802871 [Trichonephila clavipes]